jgi:hypothetical protein
MQFLQRGQIFLLSGRNFWPFWPENVEKGWQHWSLFTWGLTPHTPSVLEEVTNYLKVQWCWRGFTANFTTHLFNQG